MQYVTFEGTMQLRRYILQYKSLYISCVQTQIDNTFVRSKYESTFESTKVCTKVRRYFRTSNNGSTTTTTTTRTYSTCTLYTSDCIKSTFESTVRVRVQRCTAVHVQRYFRTYSYFRKLSYGSTCTCTRTVHVLSYFQYFRTKVFVLPYLRNRRFCEMPRGRSTCTYCRVLSYDTYYLALFKILFSAVHSVGNC